MKNPKMNLIFIAEVEADVKADWNLERGIIIKYINLRWNTYVFIFGLDRLLLLYLFWNELCAEVIVIENFIQYAQRTCFYYGSHTFCNNIFPKSAVIIIWVSKFGIYAEKPANI